MLFIRVLSLALLVTTGAIASADEPAWIEKKSWSRFFESAGVQGTIVIQDLRADSVAVYVYNPSRAKTRYTPASTFKLPHALFALDAGVLRDDQHVIPWDGKKRFHPPWNQDQTLRSSLQHSAVWVYERFASQIGHADELAYLKKIGYGNADPSGNAPFWIQGNLKISAFEQIGFLQRLYDESLPFDKQHQQMLKHAMQMDANLKGKTGWDGKLCWWVGWAETQQGPVLVALNLDTPRGKADLPLRESIARSVLHWIGVLKAKTPSSEPVK